jgi:Mg-chelatase subunit ChlD
MDGTPLAEAIEGARRFDAEYLASGHAVGLICFGSGASVLAEPSRSGIAKQLDAITCNGSTNMAAGVELAAGRLLGLQRRATPANVGPVCSPASGFLDLHGQCTMVIATDGYPDDAEAALAAAERAKRAGIRILVIGTTDCNAAFLGRLASSAKLAVVTPSGTLGKAIAHSARLLLE